MIKKILVCVKMVPIDENVKMDDHHCIDRNRVFHQMNISDMAAVEAALRRRPEASVTVLTMGTMTVIPLLQDLLARGVDEAVLLTDKAMAGSDTRATGHILAAAVKKLGSFDLILCGRRAIDGETGQVPGELSACLQIPCVTNVEELFWTGDSFQCLRLLENGTSMLEVKLPAVLSLCEYAYPLRLAGLKGRREAAAKEVKVFSSTDLGLPESECGLRASRTKVVKALRVQTGLRKGPKETDAGRGAEKMLAMIRE